MDIRSMIDEYIEFLKKEITYRQIERGYEITTPFLNDSNDYMQIYVEEIKGEDNIVLSDGGDTIAYLEDCGVNLTPTRKQMMELACLGLGVRISRERNLFIKSTIKDFAQKKHSLLQAMLKVNDMAYTTQSRCVSMFVDDVAAYFEKNEIYAMTGMSVMGKSTLYHTYDFLIGRDKYFPERFCNAVNNPTRNSIVNTIFSWNDTSDKRKDDSRFYVFLNDEKKINSEVFTALDEYKIKALPKSQMNTKETLMLFKNAV